MIRAIAIDDEPLALEIIENYAKQIPFLELIGVFTNPMEAMLFLQNNELDLIFLDIQMPLINGLKFPETVRKMPAFIYITAYEEFALKSYELNASNYLLKPVSFEVFLLAVKRFNEQSNAIDGSTSQQKNTSLFVKTDKKIVQLFIRDIIYIEGLKDYVTIYYKDKKIIARESLKHMIALLGSFGFVRVHKSYIVALTYINELDGNILRIDTKEIPVGKSFRSDLLQRMEQDMIGNR